MSVAQGDAIVAEMLTKLFKRKAERDGTPGSPDLLASFLHEVLPLRLPGLGRSTDALSHYCGHHNALPCSDHTVTMRVTDLPYNHPQNVLRRLCEVRLLL